MYMEGRGNAPKQPIDDTVFEGLPMPKKVWDDEKMDEDNSIMAAKIEKPVILRRGFWPLHFYPSLLAIF